MENMVSRRPLLAENLASRTPVYVITRLDNLMILISALDILDINPQRRSLDCLGPQPLNTRQLSGIFVGFYYMIPRPK